MFQVFNAETADGIWQEIIRRYRDGLFTHGQESRAGTTDELLHAAICIEDPRQRWIAARRSAMNVAFALAEVVWILRGRNDSGFLNYFNSGLPKFAGDGELYYGAYGWRLRKQFGLDQLERAYLTLKNNPNSRQVVLQVWDPRSDLPDVDGGARARDIPCNLSACVKVRAGKLEWLQTMRSNDVFRGLPYNIVQFTTLQEVMAGWLGLETGAYHHVSDSLHFYTNDADEAETSIGCALNSDDLRLEKEASDEMFVRLERLIEDIISPETRAETLEKKIEDFPGSIAYNNMARVLCAEGARRRKCIEVALRIIDKCGNPAFSEMFQTWLERCSRSRGTQNPK